MPTLKNLVAASILATLAFACEQDPSAENLVQNPVPTPTQTATPPKTTYKVYLTAGSHSANLAAGFANGIAGADAFCMADSARPSDVLSAKAMIVDGTNRAACSSAACVTNGPGENIDWVFKPGKNYVLSDGTTLLATADANGLLPFPLGANLGGSGAAYFTGIAANWQTSGLDCSDWTFTGAASVFVGHDSGSVANPTGTVFLQAFGAGILCTSTVRLVCVEQ